MASNLDDKEMLDYQIKVKKSISDLINTGELNNALQVIHQYEQIIQNDIEILTMKAVIAIIESDLELAESILRECLIVDVNNCDVLYNLGYIYELKKNKQMACDFYTQALRFADETLKNELITLIENIQNELSDNKTVYMSNGEDQGQGKLVSIVVLAYNKLEYTKLCIESIFKYTTGIDYELIVVNNGSTDETKEYFESLPSVKIVNLINNIGPVNGFNAGLVEAQGKYTAGICNDFILTANWLDNLLKCIESDEKIGFVSPGANFISNYQKISGEYENLDEMQVFAKEYNQSEPRKWEERVRLLPCILMVRTQILKEIGYYDARFFYGEFADDDLSYRIRRAGYKLIFAGDTFVYHFGSVTTGYNQRQYKSYEVSRKIFSDKYNIDVWGEGLINTRLINSVNYNKSGEIKILGINGQCGDTILQIKNNFKRVGNPNVKITNFTEDKKFVTELKTVSDNVIHESIKNLDNELKEKYDLIVIGNDIREYDHLEQVLVTIKKAKAIDSQIIFMIDNPTFYKNIINLLNSDENASNKDLAANYNLKDIEKIVEKAGLKISNIHRFQSEQEDIRDKIIEEILQLSFIKDKNYTKENLLIYKYVYCVN